MQGPATADTANPITDAWLAQQRGKRSFATREIRDIPGLFVRFTVLGRIEFEARYLRSWPMRVAGMEAKVRLVLGEFPKMKIEQARTERRKFTEEIRGDIDPASKRPFQRARKKKFRSVQEFFWHWFDELPEKSFSEKMVERRVVISEYEEYILSSMPKIPGWPPLAFAPEDWMDAIRAAYEEDVSVARRLWWGVNEALHMAVRVGALDDHPLCDMTFIDFENYALEEIKEDMLYEAELSSEKAAPAEGG